MSTATIAMNAYLRPLGGFLSLPLCGAFDISSKSLSWCGGAYFGRLKYESVQEERRIHPADVDIDVDKLTAGRLVPNGEPSKLGRSDRNLETLQPVGDPHMRRHLRDIIFGKLVIPDLYHQHAKGADTLCLSKLGHILELISE